jgi:hypothetical protein
METELLFEISFELADPLVVSGSPEGDRFIIYVKGGKFSGPRLAGEVLPGGGDWFLVRPDGVGTLDVRVVLKTDDGDLIYVTYRGIAKLPPGGIGSGQPFPIRTAPNFFVSSSSKYKWLNSVQAVGEGEPIPGGVRYRVFEVR